MSRLSINQVTTARWSLEQDLRFYAEVGADAVTLSRRKLEGVKLAEARRWLAASGLAVAAYGTLGPFELHAPERRAAQAAAAREEIARAAELGAPAALMMTGSGEGRPWSDSEAGFRALLEELLPAAERAGVALLFENNHMLRVDLGFVHTLHDALDLVDQIGSPRLRVCCELSNAWMERWLDEDLRERADRIGLVQLGDFAAGTLSTPARVPLGDGIIPFPRIFAALEKGGYRGDLDLELVGPEIERLGYEESIRRSLAHLHALGVRPTR